MGEDFLEKLANDPEYQRKLREKEAKRAEAEAKLRDEEAELVRELRETGMQVTLDRIPGEEYVGPPRSISDLVNTNVPYPEAIPVLIKHLGLEYSRPIKQSIVRALTTPDAKGLAFAPLVRLFRQTSDADSELKWLLGAAIAEASTKDDVDEVTELASDPGHGRGREYLPLGLVNASREKAVPILEGWANDPTLAKNAKKAIQLLR